MALLTAHGLIMLSLGIGVGFGISRSGFCLAGIFRDWVFVGNLTRLYMWGAVLCIAAIWSGLIDLMLGLFDLTIPMDHHVVPVISIRSLTGSVLFGVGLVLVQAGPMRLLVRAGHGQITGIIGTLMVGLTLIVLHLVWAVPTSKSPEIILHLAEENKLLYWMLPLFAFFIYLVLQYFDWSRKIILGIVVMTISYASMLLWCAFYPSLCSLGGYGVFVLGIIFGARLENIRQAWRIQNDLGLVSVPRQLLGMTVLGIACYMALGGLFNRSFSSMALFSLEAFVSAVTMTLSAFFWQKVLYRYGK